METQGSGEKREGGREENVEAVKVKKTIPPTQVFPA
jgi:hypothetical protein